MTQTSTATVTVTFTTNRNNDVTVHRAGCQHVGKIINGWLVEPVYDAQVGSRQDAANNWWSDFVPAEMTEADALANTSFAPCAKLR